MEPKTILFKGGVEVHFSQEDDGAGGSRTVFKCIIPPAARTPMPHYHKDFDEVVRGHKGTATWIVDGKTIELLPGQSLTIPRGVAHSFTNRTKEPIEFICYATPEVFGAAYFEDIAKVINVDGLPDFDQLQSVMRSHGLEPVLGRKQKLVFAVIRAIRSFKR